MNLQRLSSKKAGGFTLIELLVVISIVALLSSVILASLNDARKKARDATRIRAVKEIQTALQMYYHDNGYYPNGTDLNTPLVGKYIPTIDSGLIKYRAYLSDTSLTPACTNTCQTYRLGIALEDGSNRILTSDINDGYSSVTGQIDLRTNTCLFGDTIIPPSTINLCFGVKP